MAKLSSTRFQYYAIFSASLSLILIFSFVSSQNVNKKICQTKECSFAAQNLKESMNVNADPCDDFYLYACGNYPKSHINSNIIPESTIKARSDENDKEIFDFIKQNNSNDEPEAVHKARKLYSLCLNEAAFSNKTTPVENILQKIGLPVRAFLSTEVKDFDFAAVLARAARFAGVKPYFDLGVTPNPFNRTVNVIGLSKPSESFDPDVLPLNRNNKRRSKRATSIDQDEFMSEVTKRMCDDPASIICTQWNSPFNVIRDVNAATITNQNREASLVIAKPSTTLNSSASIPVIYSLKKLQDLTDSIATELNTTIPKLNWTRYVEEMFTGLDNVTLDLSDPNKVQIAIEQLDFVKDMTEFIYNIKTVKRLELGLWWSVVSTLLPYADSKIFDLKTRTGGLDSVPTREQRCAEITIASFPMAISYGYTTKEHFIKAKTEVRKMFEHIRESFSQILKELSWMDETTRQKALKKLYSLGSLIVYPSAIKTASRLNDFYKDAQITDNLFDTLVPKIQKQITKRLNKLNQVNDLNEDEWIITPNIVNAFYDPSKNAIIIPAGILGGSIYSGSLGALDYGAIGSIVGHELTHGFDNHGRHHNHIGDLEEWWQPDTSNTYREKAKCFVRAYDNYTITQNGITQQVSSKATLGEDISDSGGFKEALFGYRKCVSVNGEEPLLPQFENYTHDQLLTLSFANLWCENPTWISPILNQFSDHSPNGVRVNGVLQNSKEFAEIWKCPKGSKMNPSDEKCSVW